MSKRRKFRNGEKYRPVVTVEKSKRGTPTVIIVSGLRYIMDHKYAFGGNSK